MVLPVCYGLERCRMAEYYPEMGRNWGAGGQRYQERSHDYLSFIRGMPAGCKYVLLIRFTHKSRHNGPRRCPRSQEHVEHVEVAREIPMFTIHSSASYIWLIKTIGGSLGPWKHCTYSC